MIQTNRSATVSPESASSTKMPPARGTKTLAWFMDTDILKNGGGGGAGEGSGGVAQQSHHFNPPPAWNMSMTRPESSSDESKSTTPSSIPQSQCHLHYLSKLHKENPQKKAKRLRKVSANAAARRDGYVASSAMSTESSEDGNATVLQTPPPAQIMTSSTTSSNGAPTSSSSLSSAPTSSSGFLPASGGGGNNNEEYWFYDVASDGYYYEQNGAKGWRRRQPNSAVAKANGKEQEVAHMNVNGQAKYNQLLAAQQAAAQAAFFQQALHMQQVHAVMSQPPQPTSSGASSGASGCGGGGAQNPSQNPSQNQNANQTTMRYYDPNSDGFFYEMASVDGWKRRQPNKPVSASVPAGITRPYSQRSLHQNQGALPTASYGAALARGQFPRNTVKQQAEEEVLGVGRIHQDSTGSRGGDSASSSISEDNTAAATHFAELFGGADPLFNPVQRPSALNLEQKAVSPKLENAPSSTAALFDAMLADLNNGGGVKTPAYSHPLANYSNPQQQSPMKAGDSWNSFRSCSLFSPIKPSKRVVLGVAPSASQQPMGASGATPTIEDMAEDDAMKALMRDLDKLWASTPVSGVNQA